MSLSLLFGKRFDVPRVNYKTRISDRLKLEFYVDIIGDFILSLDMRPVSVMLLIALALTVLSPAAVFHPCGGSGTAAIGTLDVCHTAAPVVNPELPYISICPCTPLPLQLAGICEPNPLVLNLLVPAFQDEHPPKV
jgi:hypothetical protein